MQLNSMDQAICYLEKIPLDAQNRIVFFLLCDDESEEEFIDRTAPKNDGNDLFYSFFTKSNKLLENVYAYCPAFSYDKNKVALILAYRHEEKKNPKFSVYDVAGDGTQCIHDIELPYAHYSAVAISRFMRMFAIVKKVKRDKIHILEIHKIGRPAQKEYRIIDFDTITSAAFNKQGTHAVVYGVLKRQKPFSVNVTSYRIFSLRDENVEESEVNENSAETNLQQYFREKGVCKSFGKILFLQ